MHGYITRPDAPGGLTFADDLPEPDPSPGEIVVDVRAFSVNRGELSLIPARPDGWQPGQDVAGVVARTAPGGPDVGTRVVAVASGGGWAERVAVPVEHSAALPDDVGFEHAAALPIAGLTALRAIRRGGSLLGRRVLVTGATGGVGQFAVQLARASGARVTALVSSPERVAEGRELGADEVVHDLAQAHGPFSFVADGIGGRTLAAVTGLLEAGATVVTYGATGGRSELGLLDFSSAPNAELVWLFHHLPEEQKGADLAVLTGLVSTGVVTPRLGRVAAWDRLPEVLRLLAAREIRGKAVCTLA